MEKLYWNEGGMDGTTILKWGRNGWNNYTEMREEWMEKLYWNEGGMDGTNILVLVVATMYKRGL